MQNCQKSPIPQINFLPWTLFAVSYSKTALIDEMILEKSEKKLTVWKCMLKTHYNVVLATQARCRSKLGLSSSRERRQLWTSQGKWWVSFFRETTQPKIWPKFLPTMMQPTMEQKSFRSCIYIWCDLSRFVLQLSVLRYAIQRIVLLEAVTHLVSNTYGPRTFGPPQLVPNWLVPLDKRSPTNSAPTDK
jgi:hypothetical protein